MSTDLINGIIEAIGGLFIWRNVWNLYRDKEVRGVSVISTTFFTLWGFWNCLFFPIHHLWFSFSGGLVIVSANITWIGLAVRYRLQGRDVDL